MNASPRGFARSVATLAGGSAVSQAIPIVLTPVISRLYGPSDLGQLGLYVAFVSFLANSVALGFNLAIVSADTDDDARTLLRLGLLVTLPISVICSLVYLAICMRGILGYGEMEPWTAILMLLSLIFVGCFLTFRYWRLRVGHFGVISQVTVTQSVARIATQIVAGLAGATSFGLILGETIGRGAGTTRLAQGLGVKLDWNLAARRDTTKRVLSKYRKFPLIAAPSALLNSLSLVLPVPLITSFYGLMAAGQFTLSSRVMLLPLSLVGAAIGDVFHARVAELARTRPATVPRFFWIVVASLFALGAFPAIVVALWGEPLFELVLGDRWSLAGRMASAIVPWVLIQLAVSPVSRIVQVFKAQELKLIYDVLGLASIVGVLSLGSSEQWPILRTISLLGWSQALVYIVYLAILALVVHRHSKSPSAIDRGTLLSEMQ